MSRTSKSPRDVLVEAWMIACNSMAAFSHRNSPGKFTQQQLFACLVLKNFLRVDYRGLCQILRDCLALAEAVQLTSIPHFTTFQKAAQRLLQGPQAKRDESVEQLLGRNPRIRTAAADSTSLECTTASGYFVRRRANAESPWKTTVYHHFPKLGLICDTSNHFILAFQTSQGPGPDADTFNHLLEQASRRARIRCLLADAGYDSEVNQRVARETKGVKSVIPSRQGWPTQKPATGRYRRLMQTRFNQTRYRQRCQVETTISMIKRRQGSAVRA